MKTSRFLLGDFMGCTVFWFNWKERQIVREGLAQSSEEFGFLSCVRNGAIKMKEQVRGAHRPSVKRRVGRAWLDGGRGQGWTPPLPQPPAPSPQPEIHLSVSWNTDGFLWSPGPNAIGPLFFVFRRERGKIKLHRSLKLDFYRIVRHILRWWFIFFGYIPRNVVAGSHGSYLFNVLRNLHTIFHSCCSNFHFH